MERTAVLDEARAALRETTERVAAVLRSLPDSTLPMPGTSRWSAREVAAHLVTLTDIYTEIAAGTPPSITDFTPDTVARRNDERIADISETDPRKLAGLVVDAADRLLAVTDGRPGDQEVPYVGGPIDLAALVCLFLGEPLIHGYDLATSAGVPWPIDPAVAMTVLSGYALKFGEIVNPVTTRNVTVAFAVEVRGGAQFTVRFVDGTFALEPPGAGPVDCSISADPVAFLLVATGRLSPWAAMALGLLGAGGARPELALSFLSYFVFP